MKALCSLLVVGTVLACDPYATSGGILELNETVTCTGGEGLLFDNIDTLHCNGHVINGRGKVGEFAMDHIVKMDNCIFLGWYGVMNISTYLNLPLTITNVFAKNPPSNSTAAFRFTNTTQMVIDNLQVSGYDTALAGEAIATAKYSQLNLVGKIPIDINRIAEFEMDSSTVNGTISIGYVTSSVITASSLYAPTIGGNLVDCIRPYTFTVKGSKLFGSIDLTYYGGSVEFDSCTLQDGNIAIGSENYDATLLLDDCTMNNFTFGGYLAIPNFNATNLVLIDSSVQASGYTHNVTGLSLASSSWMQTANQLALVQMNGTNSPLSINSARSWGGVTLAFATLDNCTTIIGGELAITNLTLTKSGLTINGAGGAIDGLSCTDGGIDIGVSQPTSISHLTATGATVKVHPTTNSSTLTIADSTITQSTAGASLLECDDAPLDLVNTQFIDKASQKSDYLVHLSGSFVTLDDVQCTGGTCFSITAGTVSGSVTAASADVVCCAVIATVSITMDGSPVQCAQCF